jgi:hypothetical protein
VNKQGSQLVDGSEFGEISADLSGLPQGRGQAAENRGGTIKSELWSRSKKLATIGVGHGHKVEHGVDSGAVEDIDKELVVASEKGAEHGNSDMNGNQRDDLRIKVLAFVLSAGILETEKFVSGCLAGLSVNILGIAGFWWLVRAMEFGVDFGANSAKHNLRGGVEESLETVPGN